MIHENDDIKIRKLKKHIEKTVAHIKDYDADNDDEKAKMSLLDNSKCSIVYTKRPQNSKFTQQNLPGLTTFFGFHMPDNFDRAWKPLLTPKFVVLLFMVSACVFIPIGVLLYLFSNSIYEFKYDYTDCIDVGALGLGLNETCHKQILKNISYNCKCRIEFQENQLRNGPIHVYYMLETYYQNHRRYVKSRDHDQLLGIKDQILTNDCNPYDYNINDSKYSYAPCGAIANSIFNDTFEIYYKHSNGDIQINISKDNLAWYSDKLFKFQNPIDFSNTIKPPNWKHNITYLKEGYKNDDLIVWMRTAAFPSFRKLYGRILVENNLKLLNAPENNNLIDLTTNKSFFHFKNFSLPKGAYYVEIGYRYIVKPFKGQKSLVLANTSWFGGQCYFLAYAYLIFGSLCFIMAITLHVLHYFYGKMSHDACMDLIIDVKNKA